MEEDEILKMQEEYYKKVRIFAKAIFKKDFLQQLDEMFNGSHSGFLIISEGINNTGSNLRPIGYEVGHYGIRADEPAYFWVVAAGIIIVQPGGVKALAGK